MPIPSLTYRYVRPSIFHRTGRAWFSIAAAIETFHDSEYRLMGCIHTFREDVRESVHKIKSESNKLNGKDLRVSVSMIDKPTKKVLDVLKKKGFEVYLVGDCVRDLILKRKPKNFNIITSAELTEAISLFPRCEVVGQRFPICHVHLEDSIVEVSSFSTCARKFSRDFGYEFERPQTGDDYTQAMIYMQPDITNNGLMFDPYAKIVYDYLGGIKDIKEVRPLIFGGKNFHDAIGILRVVRVLGRARLSTPKEFVTFVKHKLSIFSILYTENILMELNHMLAYGSAEASLRLLWRLGLLEKLLPSQAAYFLRHGLRKLDLVHNFGNHDKVETNMLLSLFSNLDNLLAPDRPCHSILWVAILAFHKALAKTRRCPIQMLRYGVFDLVTSVKGALFHMTHKYDFFKVVEEYKPRPTEMVFGTDALYLKVCAIFDSIGEEADKDEVPELFNQINYELLAMGNMQEVRRTFARVVLATLYDHILERECRLHQ